MISEQHRTNTQPEPQVSDMLQQHFGADDRYRVLNSLSLPVDKPNSKIDHLIIHRAGFILIQSQSIRGKVQVNERGEWVHSANDNWYEMPSPVMTAMSTMDAFEEMLHEHRMILLDPWLPGLEQLQHFQERQFNIIVTTPCSADLDRNGAPPETTTNTIHVESLVDRVKELTDADRAATPTFSLETPHFTIDELGRMYNFFKPLQTG